MAESGVAFGERPLAPCEERSFPGHELEEELRCERPVLNRFDEPRGLGCLYGEVARDPLDRILPERGRISAARGRVYLAAEAGVYRRPALVAEPEPHLCHHASLREVVGLAHPHDAALVDAGHRALSRDRYAEGFRVRVRVFGRSLLGMLVHRAEISDADASLARRHAVRERSEQLSPPAEILRGVCFEIHHARLALVLRARPDLDAIGARVRH